MKSGGPGKGQRPVPAVGRPNLSLALYLRILADALGVSDAWQIRTEGWDCAYQVWDLMARNRFRGALPWSGPRASASSADSETQSRRSQGRSSSTTGRRRKWVEDLDHAGGVRAPYNVIPVNLSKGEQFKSEFLSITPDNRMPVMVGPRRAGRPFDLNLRSGAIRDATRVASIHATRRGRVVADQGTGHQPVPTPQAVARARAGPSRPSIARYIFGSKRHDQRSPMLLVVK